MKKTFFFLISFCFLCTIANAQTQAQKDSLMKVLTDEACQEITKKDFSNSSKDDLEMEMGMAIMPVFVNHSDAINSILGVNITDQSEITSFAETLGMKLVTGCPGFMTMIKKSSALSGEISSKRSNTTVQSLSGTLIKLVPGDISCFLIKDASGKTEKIWWMEYFEGDELLSVPGNFNKKVTVRYREMEVYNVAMKAYIKIKVATGLTK